MAKNRLADALDFIRNYPHPHSPSVCEIAAGIGDSQSAVQNYLYLLEQQGYIKHDPKCPQTIRILKEKSGGFNV